MKKQTSIAGKEPNYVLYWPYVVAITPFYDEDNSTWSRVHYVDGKTEDYHCRCEVILEHLALAFRTSLEVIRKRAEALFYTLPDSADGSREPRKVPLVMIRGFCLVPVKYRSEEVRNSKTLGYVVYQYVEKVKRLPDSRCEILFKGGREPLEFQQKKGSVQKRMNLARKLQKQLEAEEQHWQYEICIARKRIRQRIDEQKKNEQNLKEQRKAKQVHSRQNSKKQNIQK